MTNFNFKYFIAAVVLFVVEFVIGADVHDQVIRPYGGDFLAVILMYCIARSFLNTPVLKTAIAILLIAYLIEISQYFHLVSLLGLQHSYFAKLLLGTAFSFIDLLAYTLGILTVIIIENLKNSLKNF